MSTRARTRAAAAAAAAAASVPASQTPPQPPPQPQTTKTKTHPTRKTTASATPIKQEQLHGADTSEKENIKTATSSTKSSAAPKRPKSKSPKVAHCTCSRGDDGSPMIHCAECKTWYVSRLCIPYLRLLTQYTRYHFICVDLTEPDAEEIGKLCFTVSGSHRC